ncbi:MAG: alpha/beta fold hydrolase BchO, partial [Beijerinckiaceae bacterium]
MTGSLDFEIDGADWPHRHASHFVQAGGLRQHVQVMGEGPPLLLLHGTGASSHSWRGLAPLLAERFTVIAPDLPGHGFTGYPGLNGLSMKGMAASLRALLDKLGLEPIAGIGHSAGSAILIRMALDCGLKLERIISINGALMPFGGAIGQLFQPLARMMAGLPLMTSLFAWRARDPAVVADILKQTGSKLDAEGIRLYQRLAGDSDHVSGAFGMMANWDLPQLERDLPRLATPLSLIVGQRDEMVRPSVSEAAARLAPASELIRLSGLGHLAHEEAPERVAAAIFAALDRTPLLDQPSRACRMLAAG